MKNLTDEQLNIAICEWRGIEPQFYLMKRGLFYRPDAKGYTACANEAWLVSEHEADKHVYLYDEPVTKHAATLPSHITGIEALGNMHEAESGLTENQQQDYAENLMNITTNNDCEEWPAPSFRYIHSTARQRAIALLHVVKPELFQ